MIDYFSIALTHGLLALAIWRLLSREDLDSDGEDGGKREKPWLRGRKPSPDSADRPNADA